MGLPFPFPVSLGRYFPGQGSSLGQGHFKLGKTGHIGGQGIDLVIEDYTVAGEVKILLPIVFAQVFPVAFVKIKVVAALPFFYLGQDKVIDPFQGLLHTATHNISQAELFTRGYVKGRRTPVLHGVGAAGVFIVGLEDGKEVAAVVVDLRRRIVVMGMKGKAIFPGGIPFGLGNLPPFPHRIGQVFFRKVFVVAVNGGNTLCILQVFQLGNNNPGLQQRGAVLRVPDGLRRDPVEDCHFTLPCRQRGSCGIFPGLLNRWARLPPSAAGADEKEQQKREQKLPVGRPHFPCHHQNPLIFSD